MLIKKVQLRSKWILNDTLGRLGFPLNLNAAEGKVRVLCFHGICSDDQTFINGRFMCVSQFESLLNALADKTNILSLDDYLNKNLDSNRLNVLLTFDDGYRNNLQLALPLLEKYNAPATIFCTNRTLLWMDLLDIAAAENLPLTKVYTRIPTTNNSSAHDLKHWAITQPSSVLQDFTAALSEIVDPVIKNYQVFFELLNDQDLIEFQKHRLITLANHGANHISYLHRTKEEIKEDLAACKERLLKVNASHPDIFAYPFGHFSEKINSILIEAGYQVQFVAEGNPKLTGNIHDRLVVNPFISLRNQLISIRDGKY